MEYLLLPINKKWLLTKAKIHPSLVEMKLKVNIAKRSNWFDSWKPERGDDAPRDRCEVTHLCIDGAMLVLPMKLLTCCNYSYVLSTINCLTLDTVVTLFLFI